MAVVEFIMEVVFQSIFETVPKYIGIGIKWLFYLGKKPIIEIKKQGWNTRIGLAILIILILIVVFLKN